MGGKLCPQAFKLSLVSCFNHSFSTIEEVIIANILMKQWINLKREREEGEYI